MNFYKLGQQNAVAAFTKVAIGERQAKRIADASTNMLRALESGNPIDLRGASGTVKLLNRLTNLTRMPDGSMQRVTPVDVHDVADRPGSLLNPGPVLFVAEKQLSPGNLEALRERLQREALSGRHRKDNVRVKTPTPPNWDWKPAEAVNYLNQQQGTQPHAVSYRGYSRTNEDFTPETPRWVSGSPVISSGYGGSLAAYRFPANAPVHEVGPYTRHVGVDARIPADEAARLPLTLGAENFGSWPFYERVVSHKMLEPSLVAQYKRLPLSENEYQQVRGKENPLALPPKLTPDAGHAAQAPEAPARQGLLSRLRNFMRGT